MRILVIVLLAGCSTGPGYYAAPDGGADLSPAPRAGLLPDMASGDMAQAGIPHGGAGQSDMYAWYHPETTCGSATPYCTVGGAPCCNGAQCLSGMCWATTGQSCCDGAGCNPIVVCYGGAICVAHACQ